MVRLLFDLLSISALEIFSFSSIPDCEQAARKMLNGTTNPITGNISPTFSEFSVNVQKMVET